MYCNILIENQIANAFNNYPLRIVNEFLLGLKKTFCYHICFYEKFKKNQIEHNFIYQKFCSVAELKVIDSHS